MNFNKIVENRIRSLWYFPIPAHFITDLAQAQIMQSNYGVVTSQFHQY